MIKLYARKRKKEKQKADEVAPYFSQSRNDLSVYQSRDILICNAKLSNIRNSVTDKIRNTATVP